jgi:hypothetical protein
MRIAKRLAAVAFALALFVPALAANDTVGSFVQRMAQAKNLNATDARIAADSLAAVGVHLPANLDYNERLTEGDVTKIARAAGLNVTTNRPDAVFGGDQVDQFFLTFQTDIGAPVKGGGIEETTARSTGNNGNGPAFNPYSKGKGGSKGKKKGHDFTPTEPE